MLTLFHHPMFASCRFVRLAFGEYGEELALIEEKPWVRRKEFLALNAAGTLPVLLAADWPQFRGPGGLASSEDTGLPTTWNSSQNIVWKTELPGFGSSSPISAISASRLARYRATGSLLDATVV